jgi:hypothetical protein
LLDVLQSLEGGQDRAILTGEARKEGRTTVNEPERGP